MAELLTQALQRGVDDTSRSLLRMLFYGDEMEQKKKIVGPLYGQLTFEDVPGTKKIIVISKIPQAYEVIEQLIFDLDRQEMAEIPHVVQIKYADTEDLAERLNAMFNEPGTIAPIRRTTQRPRQLLHGRHERRQPSQGNSRDNSTGGSNGQSNAGEYTPWWSSGGAGGALDEEPISNVIGRVRFVPDPQEQVHPRAVAAGVPRSASRIRFAIWMCRACR